MDEQDILKMYLFGRPKSKGIRLRSCFLAALRDARKATGRYLSNGAKKPKTNHGNWLGAVGYMILLDQIGRCLKPKGKRTKYTNNIKRALGYFDSGLKDDEINTLYALRCSFAHNFSLVNISTAYGNRSKDKLAHCFIVYEGESEDIVDLPDEKWDGDFSRDVTDCLTQVNLEAFGDLVERICSKVIECYKQSQLETTIPADEFRACFFFQTGNPYE